MKKVISITALLILLVSCGGPSKVAKEARKTFDGTWTLTNITYPNNTVNIWPIAPKAMVWNPIQPDW